MTPRRPVLLVVLLLLLNLSCTKDAAITPDPEYRPTVLNSPAPGTILISPFIGRDTGYLQILNERGNVITQKQLPGAAFCFRKWDIDGEIRYTYFVDDNDQYHIPEIDEMTGYWVIADSALNEIKQIHLLPYADVSPGTDKPDLDVHDIILLSDNHFYTMAYYPKKVSNIPASLNPAAGVIVVAFIIQEVRDDEVVWQWDSTDYPELYANSVEDNDFTNAEIAQDYMHTNSMIVDPRDGNLILSSRHQDQVIKISHKTGDIIWRLGGKTDDFALTEEQHFLRQHDASLINDGRTLLLFDNGEKTVRPYSRILEFQIDESEKKITSFKHFSIPKNFSQFMGSVQKIGDNYFIGGGSEPYILEIDAETGEKALELTGERISYRAYRHLNALK